MTQFEELTNAESVSDILDQLAQSLREQGKYHELFEALKLQVRHRLDLPLLYNDRSDQLDDATRDQLETGLINACREVGLLLLEKGDLVDGWMYMRPVGDRQAVTDVLKKTPVDESNLDDFVQLAISEGLDVGRGFEVVLEHYGTCNAITTFESALHERSADQQRDAAAILVRHLYEELKTNVVADIQQQSGQAPTETSLQSLFDDRDWLFDNQAYHVDTTHLASVLRFARLLDDPNDLQMALEMARYGERLAEVFQYQGDEPFAEVYTSHATYFQALLDVDRDASVDYFAQKAASLDPQQHGTVAIEVYIDLLARIGRAADAVQEALKAFDQQIPPGLMPMLMELCQEAGDFQPLLDYCQARDEELGYGTLLALQSAQAQST